MCLNLNVVVLFLRVKGDRNSTTTNEKVDEVHKMILDLRRLKMYEEAGNLGISEVNTVHITR